MAWHVGAVDGTPVIYHSGDNANYAAFLLMAPEEDLGIALLINMNGWKVNNAAQQLSEGVLAILLDKAPSPYKASPEVLLAQGSAIVPALVALLWIGWTVFRFIRRSKRTPAPRRGFMWWTFVLILPALLDLILLIVLLVGIPTLWQLPLNGFAQMFPDSFVMIMLSAAGLAVWGVLRTILTLGSRVRSLLNAPDLAVGLHSLIERTARPVRRAFVATLPRRQTMLRIEIHIKGRITPQWSEWFAGLSIEPFRPGRNHPARRPPRPGRPLRHHRPPARPGPEAALRTE